MKAAQRVQSLEPAISRVAFDLPTRQRGSPKGIPRVVSVLISVTIDRAVSGHRAAMAQLINAGKTPYVVQTV